VASGSNGKGVYGSANAGTGAMGVYGASTQGHGVQGYGVIGVVGNGTTWGVYGNVGTTNGIGVNATAVGPGGTAVHANGGSYGVHVTSAGGTAFYNEPGPGWGVVAHGSFVGGSFTGGDSGVYCIAANPTGSTYGVYAEAGADGGYGVYGTGPYAGVRGDSSSVAVWGHGRTGVFGEATGTGVQGGTSNYTTENGVVAFGSTYALYASTNTGWGIWCQGDMRVTGTVNPAAVVQQIDHPQDPEHKWLSQSLVSSGEALNVQGGTVTLDATGAATVRLPGYFSVLTGAADLRYQLTAIGAAAPNLHVSQEVTANRFEIAGGAPGQKVSWQVSGVRKDAYATAHPLRVETRKSKKDQGTLMFVPKGSNAKLMQTGPTAVAVARHHPLPRAPRPPVPTR
jgi:hypothetical protein